MPTRQVDDTVQIRQQRVDVVGDEDGGDALLTADARDQRRHSRLVGQVQAVERLVQEQQPRAARKRLRDQNTLLLAA